MKIIYKWWLSLTIYLSALILFIAADQIGNHSDIYLWFLLLSAVILFMSILFQLSKKRWLKAITSSVLSFFITMIGFGIMFIVGTMSELSSGYTTILDEQFYISEFEKNTHIIFPKTAYFLAKDDTIHGAGFENEFDAYCLIKLSKAEYKEILTQISSNTSFQSQEEHSDVGVRFTHDVKPTDFVNTFINDNVGSSWYTISFHKDQETVAMKISTY